MPGKKSQKTKKESKELTEQEKAEAGLIVEAITLFKNVVPGDFATKGGPYARPATRQAVLTLVKRIGIDGLAVLIAKYDAASQDQYRPTAGTVFEFCTYKLAKIEAYVQRNGKLWAQKKLSNIEQSAYRNSRIKEKLEAGRRELEAAKSNV